jgi:hypothetical protein
MVEKELDIQGLRLDESMKKVVKDADWVAAVTRSCEGFHLIAVWNVVILGPGTLGLYAGGMFTTANNLKQDPYIELLAASKKHNLGYRFEGNGMMVNKKDLDAKIFASMKNANPKFFDISHSILLVDLKAATKLI